MGPSSVNGDQKLAAEYKGFEEEYFATLPLARARVAVVGLGYVGWPLAKLISRKRYQVIGIEADPGKLDSLADNELGITVRSDFSQVADCSTIIICVPTPVRNDYEPDLSLVESACRSVGNFLAPGQLVVLESTVNPGVCESIVGPVLEEASGLVCGEDFHLAHCPERINPGDDSWRVDNIPRVVGSNSADGLKRAVDFYRSILGAKVKPMRSIKEAEAVKIVENSFRDLNIAFVNELAMSFSKMDIDVVNVIEGAATKPFAYMAHYPGCGIGGHCIPVDPYYLISHARSNGFNHELLSLARNINNRMPEYTVDILVRALKEEGLDPGASRVAVLGLAYKPEVDDCRESPAFHILNRMEQVGIDTVIYDPHVRQGSSASSLGEALTGVDAVMLATAHKLFVGIGAEVLVEKGIRIIIDGRNCLAKEKFAGAGIKYYGIGR